MALSIAGRTAIVTGAGSGINLAFARALLRKRCNVVFADLKLRPEAQELVSNHSGSSQSSAKAVFQQTDVTDWQHLERMFHIAKKEFGGVDIVCPGAGVYEPVPPPTARLSSSQAPSSNFWHPPGSTCSTDASAYASLSINLSHPIRTTQLAISHFLSDRSHPSTPTENGTPTKSIIHVSSIAGQTTPLAAPLYVAAKHGISGFVRTLAPLEQRFGIRVAAVAPGVVRTPLWTDHPRVLRMVTGEDLWVEPDEVMEAMMALVEGGEVEVLQKGGQEGTRLVTVEGGMVLEVGKGRVRVVDTFMDEGPSGDGHTVSNVAPVHDEIFNRLHAGTWGLQE
ncbi:hypothetical protein MMC29_006861, partial [Sticta canariensis]|nr:hypothetical protein [Sticta canariensis]